MHFPQEILYNRSGPLAIVWLAGNNGLKINQRSKLFQQSLLCNINELCDKLEQMIPQMGSKTGISVVKMGVLVKGMSVLCLNKMNSLKTSILHFNAKFHGPLMTARIGEADINIPMENSRPENLLIHAIDNNMRAIEENQIFGFGELNMEEPWLGDNFNPPVNERLQEMVDFGDQPLVPSPSHGNINNEESVQAQGRKQKGRKRKDSVAEPPVTVAMHAGVTSLIEGDLPAARNTQLGFYDGTLVDPEIDGDQMLRAFLRDDAAPNVNTGVVELPENVGANDIQVENFRPESPVNIMNPDQPPDINRRRTRDLVELSDVDEEELSNPRKRMRRGKRIFIDEEITMSPRILFARLKEKVPIETLVEECQSMVRSFPKRVQAKKGLDAILSSGRLIPSVALQSMVAEGCKQQLEMGPDRTNEVIRDQSSRGGGEMSTFEKTKGASMISGVNEQEKSNAPAPPPQDSMEQLPLEAVSNLNAQGDPFITGEIQPEGLDQLNTDLHMEPGLEPQPQLPEANIDEQNLQSPIFKRPLPVSVPTAPKTKRVGSHELFTKIGPNATFEKLFPKGRATKTVAALGFFNLLKLQKQKKIILTQRQVFGSIGISRI